MKRSLLAVFIVVLLLPALAPAQNAFTVLYTFQGTTDGASPDAGLIADHAGNLYGTTYGGGSFNYGLVFKLNTSGHEIVKHNFTGGSDGYFPFTPLLRDAHGNLYGVTAQGGTDSYGVVYKIDTAGNESILYTFAGGANGCYPSQGLIMDKPGTLYGTFGLCGSYYSGGIFTLTSDGTFTVLHTFAGGASDGATPHGGHLVMDKRGNLYGLTLAGGKADQGVLYKLAKNGTVTVLHSFAGKKDGCQPGGTVAVDTAGALYGIANACGASNYGTIWKVSKKHLTILHSFSDQADGRSPNSGVVLDSRGNMFGVAQYGGANNASGVLYELSQSGKFTALHSFNGSDGEFPNGEVVRDANGGLYGTTNIGGNLSACGGTGCGTVWSYK
jgi:uncharacterized repeat protein (TIGR03803 family)